MFKVSACINVLIIWFKKMSPSNFRKKDSGFDVNLLEHLGSEIPSSRGMLTILIEGNLLWDFIIFQKGNIVFLTQCDWSIFGNFHLNGTC